MKNASYIFLLLAGIIGYLEAKKGGTRKDIVRILKFGNCDEAHLKNPDLSHFENVTIVNVGNGMNAVNGKLVHKRDVESIYALVHFLKCRSRDGTDCESFGSYKLDEFCDFLVQTDRFWTPLFEAFRPSLRCPAHKNIYELRNATLDADKIISVAKYIPNASGFFWKANINLYSLKQREYFGCMMMMYQHAQIRIRNSD